ncbi:DUF2252 domain-containing protein [Microbacterium sp. No. 7]|uniref:DUF2252 domain-containing protein n=1 Tax=Microbacterium sp. No. 7 TaxID=1714373 RepID=UPI0006D2484B|nr:DUF2252 domain-containing protein [Microbacterium sp. No. 7]ALJ18790.1 hypothetical protein AOA12_02220 [Microbacterium sp. No. 7]
MPVADWTVPPPTPVLREAGEAARKTTPRRLLAELETSGRDPLGILDAQNATRLPELVPLRVERMSASPFAFYRGTAALMAADLARGPSTGIQVASCGDAHVANFGFYASPQRTLVFDLNDFDESAWAPFEWDLKRLVTSIVIAGQATGRDETVTRRAAHATVHTYARAMQAANAATPLQRYFAHFDADSGIGPHDDGSREVVQAAMKGAAKRTGERAARKLTERGDDGRLRFIEQPPTMVHADERVRDAVDDVVAAYMASTRVDVRLVLSHYSVSDTARRVVGVGSVGTRCYISVLEDGDGRALLLQTKEAGCSVLIEHGGCPQPPSLLEHIDANGEGGRVVALQRILQGVSDPFLGYLRRDGFDYYVRQFRDMKYGIDVEQLGDGPFHRYALACAAVLARAHAQSPRAGEVVGYLGGGRRAAAAVVDWSYAYADLSRADYDAFVAAYRPAG